MTVAGGFANSGTLSLSGLYGLTANDGLNNSGTLAPGTLITVSGSALTNS